MQLITYPDAESFLRDAQPELEEREAEHNLVLGLALRLRDDPPASGNPPLLATVQDPRGLLVAALMTQPRPLVLANLRPDGEDVALELVAKHLIDSGSEVSGVVAPNPLSESFAQRWSRISGNTVTIGMRQRLYRLIGVRQVPVPDGELRRALNTDLDVVSRWMAAFTAEALQEEVPDRARRAAKERIDQGEIYLWEDTEPRSMAASTRPTRGGIAINAVYTPPPWRRRGFATACVARLSEHLLNTGYSFCVLFTDLANLTSNSIYTRIGYEPVCDFTLYRFGSDPA